MRMSSIDTVREHVGYTMHQVYHSALAGARRGTVSARDPPIVPAGIAPRHSSTNEPRAPHTSQAAPVSFAAHPRPSGIHFIVVADPVSVRRKSHIEVKRRISGP
nr:hypothetical protein CFP56_56577 [Quercus suber]